MAEREPRGDGDARGQWHVSERTWRTTKMAERDAPRAASVVFAKRPKGEYDPNEQFQVVQGRGSIADVHLTSGQVLVRVVWLAMEPAMRGWMDAGGSYAVPMRVGEVMRGSGVGQVVASQAKDVKTGDLVTGAFGWCAWKVMAAKHCRLVDAKRPTRALSLFGWSGLAAYFGLLRVGTPKRGECVLVSAAAGATGIVAVQIAKHVCGCRVVGVAGGTDKVKQVMQVGADACVDYKKEGGKHLLQDIAAACPHGVDVFFDNVGGEVLDGALRILNMNARVVICGAISRYNDKVPAPGPRYYMNLLVKRAKMEGFLVLDYESEFPAAMRDLQKWEEQGKVKMQEDVMNGSLETLPFALQMLFRGENNGKLIVKIAEVVPRSKL